MSTWQAVNIFKEECKEIEDSRFSVPRDLSCIKLLVCAVHAHIKSNRRIGSRLLSLVLGVAQVIYFATFAA